MTKLPGRILVRAATKDAPFEFEVHGETERDWEGYDLAAPQDGGYMVLRKKYYVLLDDYRRDES